MKIFEVGMVYGTGNSYDGKIKVVNRTRSSLTFLHSELGEWAEKTSRAKIRNCGTENNVNEYIHLSIGICGTSYCAEHVIEL